MWALRQKYRHFLRVVGTTLNNVDTFCDNLDTLANIIDTFLDIIDTLEDNIDTPIISGKNIVTHSILLTLFTHNCDELSNIDTPPKQKTTLKSIHPLKSSLLSLLPKVVKHCNWHVAFVH